MSSYHNNPSLIDEFSCSLLVLTSFRLVAEQNDIESFFMGVAHLIVKEFNVNVMDLGFESLH